MPASSNTLSRRERERQRRRRAMLDAAQSVFAEKGYARATLDEIAERAEFGKGTLYNYFDGGKEGILFAIFDSIFDDTIALIEDTCPAERAAHDGLRAAYHDLVVRAFEYYMEQEDLFIILIKEAHRLAFGDDEEKAAYFHAQHERKVNALLPAVETAIDAGGVASLPPRAVANMLLENLNGLVAHRCMCERHEGGAATDATGSASDAAPSAVRPKPDVLSDPTAAADFLTRMLFDGLQPRFSGASSSSA
jgi:AcrR family transcriptional regulator